jgi:hypothetical protein
MGWDGVALKPSDDGISAFSSLWLYDHASQTGACSDIRLAI